MLLGGSSLLRIRGLWEVTMEILGYMHSRNKNRKQYNSITKISKREKPE